MIGGLRARRDTSSLFFATQPSGIRVLMGIVYMNVVLGSFLGSKRRKTKNHRKSLRGQKQKIAIDSKSDT